ncbi:ASPIC/UnbV domain-containing protein [Nitritalea halalkaliphila LW7]|uniref:ASPIC/UnbV domain-containing protein n=1 Tax=Nitritalea halalkaliphila LW7 TaxID=1189621 RepID=I5C9V3_9BACT|nr:FG-GAP-like repeat-containing protein [Nitritalea halalkaliphila]EIM78605.1 ASPIC/UnbV domain-containing protein [Nitritalea halalkaliphila LW7]
MVVPDLIEDASSEDVYAVFFDANGDGHPDLYVSSGGSDSGFGDPGYTDRLYLADGAGNFIRARDALPKLRTSSSVVLPVDLTGDGI